LKNLASTLGLGLGSGFASGAVSMFVDGIFFCEPGDYMTFSAAVDAPAPTFPGTAPYTYEWYWTSGAFFNTNNLLGTSSSLTLYSPLANVFWVHLVVNSADGQQIVLKTG
jgi:hypothetical protein